MPSPKVNRSARKAAMQERVARLARYLDAKVPVGDAIRLALSPDPADRKETLRAIPEFAVRHGLNEKNTAAEIYGNRRASDATCAALAAELGGTSDYWRNLLAPSREAAATA